MNTENEELFVFVFMVNSLVALHDYFNIRGKLEATENEHPQQQKTIECIA